MAKRTINAKEILADIKAGMDNAAQMESYQFLEIVTQDIQVIPGENDVPLWARVGLSRNVPSY
jgi:hypothetical protein